MTYKQIEQSREIRLWIKDIIIPACAIAVSGMALVPEFRDTVVNKATNIKQSIDRKLKKG